MILQALFEYYQRKSRDSGIAPFGLENKEIPFIIEIDKDGKFLDLKDTREENKGNIFLVPKSIKRSGTKSWQSAFLLWDHYGFVLGHPKKEDTVVKQKEALETAQKQKDSFVGRIENLPPDIKNDKGVKAILSFYSRSEDKEVLKSPNWETCKKIPGCNMSFQLTGDLCLVPERPAVRDYARKLVPKDRDVKEGRCLVTGSEGKITRIHSLTRIPGSKSNAVLVGCQRNSGFDSYRKEQAFNSPISPEAENGYTTALKHLAWSTDSRILIGDTTIIFWSEPILSIESTLDMEKLFPWFFTDPPKDDPDRGVQAVRSLYRSVYSGILPGDEKCKFYVLGLSPNGARISVRFWRNGSVKDFGGKIFQHFKEMEVDHGPWEPEHLSLSRILRSIALKNKMDNVPPNLPASVVTSILDGTPYPITLAQQCIRRIRAERNVNRSRAGILKAWINRYPKLSEREVATVALDRGNKNEGYRLGRLFAVLEKIQEEANPGINATIRDRYYGAASSTPVTVFSQLLKLKNHHLSKLDNVGRKVFFEKEIGEIMGEIDHFPEHLTLEGQAFFAIGYYHQRQEFFKKNPKENSDSQ